MAFGRINFESEKSVNRMLEIQRLTRHRALRTTDMADYMQTTPQVVWPFVRHMVDNGDLAIVRKESTKYGCKPINFYRWAELVSTEKMREPVIKRANKPVQRDWLQAAFYGAA